MEGYGDSENRYKNRHVDIFITEGQPNAFLICIFQTFATFWLRYLVYHQACKSMAFSQHRLI